MVDLKTAEHLAFEAEDGNTYGAKYISDHRLEPKGYGSVRVFGKPWFNPGGNGPKSDFWVAQKYFTLKTGVEVSRDTVAPFFKASPNNDPKPFAPFSTPGKLLVSPVSLLNDFDTAAGRALWREIDVFEERELRARGGPVPGVTKTFEYKMTIAPDGYATIRLID